MNNTIQIVIVDDHQIVRDGIKAMLLTCKGIKVAGEAANHEELTNALRLSTPDVIVLDITLPNKSGIEITKELKDAGCPSKILILSANTDEENIVGAIKAGANGFLPKDTPRDEFIEAITLVSEGEEYFGEKLSKIIYKSYIHHVKMRSGAEQEPCLSEREIEIVKLLADGLSVKEIASQLFVSPRTIETHKTNILNKLNLKNPIELVRYAIKHGIVKL